MNAPSPHPPAPDAAATCRVPGCRWPRAHDGLCQCHLWDTEHHTGYLASRPHAAVDNSCPLCLADIAPEDSHRLTATTDLSARVTEAYAHTRRRLLDLTALQPGWLDGTGQALRRDVAQAAGRILDRCEAAAVTDAASQVPSLALLPAPALFPCEDGGLNVMFTLPSAAPRERTNHSYLEFDLGDPDLPDLYELTAEGADLTSIEHVWSSDADSLLRHLRTFAAKHHSYLQDWSR